MKKSLYFYFILLLIGSATLWIVSYKEGLAGFNGTTHAGVQPFIFGGSLNIQHILDKLLQAPGILILQLIVIILVARLMGYLFQLIGQPLVIGEIVAGMILGPSLLGALAPQLMNYIFPQQSIDVLQQLSQLGLIFFMFIIGMELDTQAFRKSANKAILISIASIVIPFISGVILAYYLHTTLAIHQVRFSSFALFMGTTMSITAFPILARIVQERKLFKTSVGNMAITIAAIGDVVAWCMLAVVIAIVKAGGFSSSFLTIGLSIAYIFFMLYVVKPVMYRIGRVYSSREAMSKPIVALVFLLILLSSLITEAIGIHALFGAFMAGVVMPENLSFKRTFTEKIEDVSLVILLPLFFVSTGLRTEIGLINTGQLWLICAIITSTAILGKFGGTLLASRYSGLNWHHSLTLGVLMNAKGLMELIVLNIGYDLGILSPEVFAMLVLMALATTLITGPGLNLVNFFIPERFARQPEIDKAFRVMLSFANPKMGNTLLRLVHMMVTRVSAETRFTALHISRRTDLSPDNARLFEKESFSPIRRFAHENKLELHTIYRNTSEISNEIIETCNTEKPDMLILGSARTIFSSDILGGIIKRIIHDSACDVLIFNEKSFNEINSILIVYFGNGDDFLFNYAKMFNHVSKRKFYTYHRGLENKESANALMHSGIQMASVSGSLLDPAFLKTIDLVMVSEKNWKTLEGKNNLPVNQFPSLLIIHKTEARNRLLMTYQEEPGSER